MKKLIDFAPIMPLINSNECDLFKVHKEELKRAKESYKKVWPASDDYINSQEFAFYLGVCFAVQFSKKEERKLYEI